MVVSCAVPPELYFGEPGPSAVKVTDQYVPKFALDQRIGTVDYLHVIFCGRDPVQLVHVDEFPRAPKAGPGAKWMVMAASYPLELHVDCPVTSQYTVSLDPGWIYDGSDLTDNLYELQFTLSTVYYCYNIKATLTASFINDRFALLPGYAGHGGAVVHLPWSQLQRAGAGLVAVPGVVVANSGYEGPFSGVVRICHLEKGVGSNKLFSECFMASHLSELGPISLGVKTQNGLSPFIDSQKIREGATLYIQNRLLRNLLDQTFAITISVPNNENRDAAKQLSTVILHISSDFDPTITLTVVISGLIGSLLAAIVLIVGRIPKLRRKYMVLLQADILSTDLDLQSVDDVRRWQLQPRERPE